MNRFVLIGGLLAGFYLLTRLFKEDDCGCSKKLSPVVKPLPDTKIEVSKQENPFTTKPQPNELRDTMIDAINMSNLSTNPDFLTTNEFFGNG